MWKRLTVAIIPVFAFATPTFAQLEWAKASPGGGGSFQTVDLADNGTVLAGSDLSGAYLRLPGADGWRRLGRRDGLDATSVEVVRWKPGQSAIALIGTRKGLYRTTNPTAPGVTWTKIPGFSTPDEDVTAIAWWKSGSDVVYAASAD
jgi:hypothetical protein